MNKMDHIGQCAGCGQVQVKYPDRYCEACKPLGTIPNCDIPQNYVQVEYTVQVPRVDEWDKYLDNLVLL